jgi:hypothetical protein
MLGCWFAGGYERIEPGETDVFSILKWIKSCFVPVGLELVHRDLSLPAYLPYLHNSEEYDKAHAGVPGDSVQEWFVRAQEATEEKVNPNVC